MILQVIVQSSFFFKNKKDERLYKGKKPKGLQPGTCFCYEKCHVGIYNNRQRPKLQWL